MKKLSALKETFIRHEAGASTVEYALIMTGIALALVATGFAFGDELKALFSSMTGK